MTKPKLMFFVSEDWAFMSHRLPMARAALQAGFHVCVACRVSDHREQIEAMGIEVVPIAGIRGSLSPKQLVKDIKEIASLYREYDPDIVHHISIKMCLIGSLAAWRTKRQKVVNSFTGLGFLFTATSLKAKLIRAGVMSVFRLCLNRSGVVSIVQNDDDGAVIDGLKLSRGHKLVKIVGSGVDIERFQPAVNEPAGPVRAICVARMLKDKGIIELAEAARLLKQRSVPVQVVLVGDADLENPQSLTREQLQAWADEGIVEWLGHRRDIDEIYRTGHVAVLPSYREGLPKSLLEGAATGLAMLTTDVPGCRELVSDGVNGLVVPVRDAEALADGLQRLVEDEGLRLRLGAEARRQVEAELSDKAVSQQTLELYMTALT